MDYSLEEFVVFIFYMGEVKMGLYADVKYAIKRKKLVDPYPKLVREYGNLVQNTSVGSWMVCLT